MALLAESKRIAAEFEFTDDDVRKNVAEFIHQMSGYPIILRFA
jgi:hexokinase